ncbi:MAG TPA: DUF3108 domain-containing protein [Chthoniobacteraceae bacterium]|jgi:hypothetical protein|nr:DUF3108 domain-containing protein [Chthoniobacteraceae bacterium]
MTALRRRGQARFVRGLLAVALLLLCANVRADWQESLTTTAGTFPPLRPLKAHYKFGWTAFSAAEADFDFTKAKGVSRLAVTAKSIGVVRGMWKMDSQAVSTMSADTMRPISLNQTEVYRTESEKTKVDYTDTAVARLRESTPAHGEPRVKTFEYPNVHDLQSAFHFLRSQKLATGDVYRVVVYPSVDPYLAQVEVQGRPQRKIAGAKRATIQLNLKLWRIAKDLTLDSHEKFKRATIYLSDDPDRLLLRIEGELTVGSVWCELDKIEFKK